MAETETTQRFPFVSLEKALDRAKALYEADTRGAEMPLATAFQVWGYSEKSSGGFQTVAALKMYGLLRDSGSGEGRKVRLTSEAMHYFLDERDEERSKLVQSFATTPKLLASLWQDWGTTPPSDTVARSHLKIDRGLNEQSARTVLGLYRTNLTFAGLKGHAKIPSELGVETDSGAPGVNGETPKAQAKVGDYVQWVSGGQIQFEKPRQVAWVSDDQTHVRVHGSQTGISMAELEIAEPPTVYGQGVLKAGSASVSGEGSVSESRDNINVLMVAGHRLEITADVDLKGLRRLKKMLDKYEEILTLTDDSQNSK